MLSQVEAGKSTPTITLLYRIALALDLPPSELVEDRFRASHLEVVRAGRSDRRYNTHQNCAGVKLTPPWLDQDLEFYRFGLPVGGALKSQPHAPHTHEITTVAQGKIKVVSAGEEAILTVGDSARYSADVPHSLINVGKTAAVRMWWRITGRRLSPFPVAFPHPRAIRWAQAPRKFRPVIQPQSKPCTPTPPHSDFTARESVAGDSAPRTVSFRWRIFLLLLLGLPLLGSLDFQSGDILRRRA